jgi:hypothetical protein
MRDLIGYERKRFLFFFHQFIVFFTMASLQSGQQKRVYEVLSCEMFADMALRMQASNPDRFHYHASKCEIK